LYPHLGGKSMLFFPKWGIFRFPLPQAQPFMGLQSEPPVLMSPDMVD